MSHPRERSQSFDDGDCQTVDANQPLRQPPFKPWHQSLARSYHRANMSSAMPVVCFNSSLRKTLISILALLGVGAIGSASAQAQTFTRIASFDGANGAFVYGPLSQGPDGRLYSAANGGGVENCGVIASGCGTIFSVNQHGELKLLHTFCLEDGCPDGASPFGGLLWTSNGYFYATTGNGGVSGPGCASGCGTVYRLNSAGRFETVQNNFSWDGVGAGPESPLVQTLDGSLYGTTIEGPVFAIELDGQFLLTINLGDYGSSFPLIQGTDGNFYGASYYGVQNGCACGVVFELTSFGNLITLHAFSGPDGEFPNGPLIQALDGSLYGTTAQGGSEVHCDCGTIFRIDPNGAFTSLHSFHGRSDGRAPTGLIQATDGDFYGVTAGGGNGCGLNTCGTVFGMNQAGQVSTLHVFPNSENIQPSSLLQATDGNLYGTTVRGGDDNDGSIFRMDIGLSPFVALLRYSGRIGDTGGILGQGFMTASKVELNGTPIKFKVISDTLIEVSVPEGAASGYVTVTTDSGILTSNKPFQVIP
jgi:uncharacterized repeat protein (TIGR03803 family)